MSPTADDAVVDYTTAEQRLKELVPAASAENLPQIESLFDLRCNCDELKPDAEFWQWVAIAAAKDLTGIQFPHWSLALNQLYDHRSTWPNYSYADGHAIVAGEINLFLSRVMKDHDMATKTRASKAPLMTLEDDEQDEEFEGIRAKGKSRAKGSTAADPPQTSAELLAGMEVVDDLEVDHSKIKRSKENPRQSFDESLIAEMAPNIVTICKMNPITVREGSLEIIDGETRHRAGELGKAKTLRCLVIRCTDAQAAAVRFLTSQQRRPLNPIEKAQALQALLDRHGISQRELAKIVKMEQGSISNATRLLKLPDEWKELVISNEITAFQIRKLIPWLDEPVILKRLLKDYKSIDEDERRGGTLEELLDEVLFEESEGLQTYSSGHSITLKPTPEQREKLRIREVQSQYGHKQDRCFNVDYWNELVAAEVERIEKRAEKRQAKEKSGAIDAKKAAENAKKQAETIQKRLYRYRTAWYQTMLIASLPELSDQKLMRYSLWLCVRPSGRDLEHVGIDTERRYYGADDITDLEDLLKVSDDKTRETTLRLLQDWFNSKFEGWNVSISPQMFEALARDAGVDLKRDWPKSCKNESADFVPLKSFLELLTKDQLSELIVEWKLPPDVDRGKKTSTIEAMVDVAKGKPVPKALLDVQPIRLV